jgi:hypothetical protein
LKRIFLWNYELFVAQPHPQPLSHKEGSNSGLNAPFSVGEGLGVRATALKFILFGINYFIEKIGV